jgi:sugar-specific transcriptional regulator TrmB
MLEQLLARLGLDAGEQKTYLELLESGPSSAGSLSRRSGVNRGTQYLFLKRLIQKGFVTQTVKRRLQLFSAKEPRALVPMYEEKIGQLQQDYEQYKKILPGLLDQKPHRQLLPKFEIFEGVEGLKNVLKDMLLYRDMETQAYWPIKKMLELLGEDFFREHNKKRIANNLFTRAIWPATEVVSSKDYPYLGSGKAFKREIRIAPKEISFRMGYWIYGNKVAFLSSRKESFGYIIESREFVEMLLSQFEIIWNLSKSRS